MTISPAALRRLPLLIAAGATGFIAATLLREYNNGGIKAHHFLQRSDMPALSNAWGLLILPVLGWLTGYYLLKRLKDCSPAAAPLKILVQAAVAFAGALAAGFLMSWLFQQDKVDILQWVPLVFLLLSVLLPVYRGEYLLGLVMGMTVTFGPVIPVLFGGVFAVISVLVQLGLIPWLRKLFKKS